MDRPIKTKCFITFLNSLECKSKRSKGSHFHYKCPGCFRPVVIREAEKEIPTFHIRSNLKTLGISFDTFEKWILENC
jgi:predicted RNA binding protein YcfA (HicA-like mRNA interferase family)